MNTLTFNDDYEKAITKLALREYATAQFHFAVNDIKAGNLEKSRSATERGEIASALANQLEN